MKTEKSNDVKCGAVVDGAYNDQLWSITILTISFSKLYFFKCQEILNKYGHFFVPDIWYTLNTSVMHGYRGGLRI